jgi:ABC-type transporter Mla MlaB component
VKFGHASALREPKRSAHMSTKTTKRKRAATAAVESPRPAPRALSTDVAATNTIVAADAAPVSTRDSLATSSPVVSLFSNSTVKDAAALKGTLLQVLEAPTVTIDATSVERIDTAVIQALCAFVRDRAQRSLSVTWRGTPQPLVDAARLLGIGAMLALPGQATEV